MAKLCPKCAKPLDADHYCEHCDLSIHVYEKIYKTSRALYNQGLQKAKVRDLSAAIDLLSRSIRLDKTNSEARNLLGLIYFEIGETVTALQQWVVSKNLKPEDNEAIYFLNQVQNNQSYLDKLNQAIKKYNQSLTYIEQGSTDLAIIQLKKVISLNNNFVKAYALLALCYMREKQVPKAQKILLKILSIDKSSYVARKYLDEISSDAVNSEDFVDQLADQFPSSNGIAFNPIRTKVNGAFFQFIAMVIGVAIGLSIMFFMVMPGRLDEKDSEINSLNSDVLAFESSLTSIEAEVAELKTSLTESQASDLEKDDFIKNQTSILKESNKVLSAMALYVNDQGAEAADALFVIEEGLLSPEVATIYQNIVTSLYPVVSEESWLEGLKAYRNKRYEEGIPLLEVAYKYNKTADYSDEALYYLARCYYKLDDIDTAIPIFQKLLEEYPEANNKSDAQYFVNLHSD